MVSKLKKDRLDKLGGLFSQVRTEQNQSSSASEVSGPASPIRPLQPVSLQDVANPVSLCVIDEIPVPPPFPDNGISVAPPFVEENAAGKTPVTPENRIPVAPLYAEENAKNAVGKNPMSPLPSEASEATPPETPSNRKLFSECMQHNLAFSGTRLKVLGKNRKYIEGSDDEDDDFTDCPVVFE